MNVILTLILFSVTSTYLLSSPCTSSHMIQRFLSLHCYKELFSPFSCYFWSDEQVFQFRSWSSWCSDTAKLPWCIGDNLENWQWFSNYWLWRHGCLGCMWLEWFPMSVSEIRKWSISSPFTSLSAIHMVFTLFPVPLAPSVPPFFTKNKVKQ